MTRFYRKTLCRCFSLLTRQVTLRSLTTFFFLRLRQWIRWGCRPIPHPRDRSRARPVAKQPGGASESQGAPQVARLCEFPGPSLGLPSSASRRSVAASLFYNPSGHASLPDYLFLLWASPMDTMGLPPHSPPEGPKPGAPSGAKQPAERRESQGAPQVARLCEFPGPSSDSPLRFAALCRRFSFRFAPKAKIVPIPRLRFAFSVRFV